MNSLWKSMLNGHIYPLSNLLADQKLVCVSYRKLSGMQEINHSRICERKCWIISMKLRVMCYFAEIMAKSIYRKYDFCWYVIFKISATYVFNALPWRHNERNGVSKHQSHACLLKRLFNEKIQKNSKAPHHWPLCGEITSDRLILRTRPSNAENVSIW